MTPTTKELIEMLKADYKRVAWENRKFIFDTLRRVERLERVAEAAAAAVAPMTRCGLLVPAGELRFALSALDQEQ